MTMPETYMAIEAAVEREESRQKHNLSVAWHVAALQRQKRMPSLSLFLNGRRARQTTPEEMALRRQEHAQMTRKMDAQTLNMLGNRLEKAKAQRRIN